MAGKLYIVGLGPGALDHLTPAAGVAIAAAETVVGYRTYVELVAGLVEGKQVVASGMRQEVERCREALRLAAAGQTVALVSSGDAGIYGMAGLALELQPGEAPAVEIEIVPGVSAVQAAAARLGAPLMHDFAVVSLSDLLTPWPLIRRRLEAAGGADFVVALYNPRSRGRVTHLAEARRILLRHRSPDTPVGIVRNACRSDEVVTVTELGHLPEEAVDMLSLVLVGNSRTRIDGRGRMVTPRGYDLGQGPAAKGKGESQAQALNLSPFASRRGAVRALFVGGTGSDVGKSVIAAGLCRLLRRRGYTVAPFKAQNMALNSAVTPEGGEIGRAQALQAAACGVAPHTDMNPVLLKPNSETGSQVVIQGRPVGNMTVGTYHRYKGEALARVEESFRRLSAGHDVVVLEGAGSIAEINLRDHDIVNLRSAAMAEAPVLLVADIDRGGVFASLCGTLDLLAPHERERVAGLIINRFRGDAALLRPGLEQLEDRTGVPVLGVVPWIDLALPEEDSVALGRKRRTATGAGIRIGVVRLPRISNYTDFDSLEREPGVSLEYVEHPGQLAGLDLLILPGTKSTIPDLEHLAASGLAAAITGFHAAGGRIVGICGGFQMLGRRLADPDGVESERREAPGLGLLDIETIIVPAKQTHLVTATALPGAAALGLAAGEELTGYEIHMGQSRCGGGVAPLLRLVERSGRPVRLEDGAVSADGRVWGTYLHGIFDNQQLRVSLLASCGRDGGTAGQRPAANGLDDELDRLADHLEAHLDLGPVLGLLPPPSGECDEPVADTRSPRPRPAAR